MCIIHNLSPLDYDKLMVDNKNSINHFVFRLVALQTFQVSRFCRHEIPPSFKIMDWSVNKMEKNFPFSSSFIDVINITIDQSQCSQMETLIGALSVYIHMIICTSTSFISYLILYKFSSYKVLFIVIHFISNFIETETCHLSHIFFIFFKYFYSV